MAAEISPPAGRAPLRFRFHARAGRYEPRERARRAVEAGELYAGQRRAEERLGGLDVLGVDDLLAEQREYLASSSLTSTSPLAELGVDYVISGHRGEVLEGAERDGRAALLDELREKGEQAATQRLDVALIEVAPLTCGLRPGGALDGSGCAPTPPSPPG